MQWTLFRTGQCVFWLGIALPFVPGLPIALPLFGAGGELATIGLVLMVLGALHASGKNVRWLALRYAGWYFTLSGIFLLHVFYAFRNTETPQSVLLLPGAVLLTLSGLLTLQREPSVKWAYPGTGVAMLLPVVTQDLHDTPPFGLLVLIAWQLPHLAELAGVFVLARQYFRAPGN